MRTNVCIYNAFKGKAVIHKDVTYEKAYHLVDDYSVSIHNGHLYQSMNLFVTLAKMPEDCYWINLHTSQKIFAVVSEDVDKLKRIINS